MARMGGLFPFPLAQVAEGGTVLSLPSGGVFVLPPNQYLVVLDPQTALEFWDPQLNAWRQLFGPSTAGDVTSDGCNYRLHNITGTLKTPFTITAGTSTGLSNGIGSVQTGLGLGFTGVAGFPTPTAYAIVGGSVGAPTVTQTGSQFIVPPVVVVDPPPLGGIQASAIATVTAGGGINAITMINAGAGYAVTPNFWLIPQVPTYTGAPAGQGSYPAGVYPAPGLVHPNNSLPGSQNVAGGTAGALLTPVALTNTGLVTGVVAVNSGGGLAGSPAATITNAGTGSIGTLAIASAAVTAAANGAGVILAPRINQ